MLKISVLQLAVLFPLLSQMRGSRKSNVTRENLSSVNLVISNLQTTAVFAKERLRLCLLRLKRIRPCFFLSFVFCNFNSSSSCLQMWSAGEVAPDVPSSSLVSVFCVSFYFHLFLLIICCLSLTIRKNILSTIQSPGFQNPNQPASLN